MKIPVKHKIIISLLAGFKFATLHALFSVYIRGIEFSWSLYLFNLIFFGIFTGTIFLFIMKKFSERLLKKVVIELNENEVIQHEGPTNLFRGIEAVGGKMVLTDKRLVFKSHNMNIQNGETQFDLVDIQEVKSRKIAKLFQTGMRLLTRNNDNVDFVVYDADTWVDKINVLRSSV